MIFSEYNASYKNEPDVTDAPFMGPWLADTIRQCDGLTEMLSYWTFSDVFEEQGVVKKPFYGGYGVIAEDGLPKPAFNAFKLLHTLGDQRIADDSNSVLVTRRADGTFVIAVWNLFLAGRAGRQKTGDAAISKGDAEPQRLVSRLDATHGSLLDSYDAMGSPPYPTEVQIVQLRKAAQLRAARKIKRSQDGTITFGAARLRGLALSNCDDESADCLHPVRTRAAAARSAASPGDRWARRFRIPPAPSRAALPDFS